jgi:hypothetical protein
MLLGRHTCTDDSITLGRNIVTYALVQTDLYKWYDHTWLELHSILTYALRQIYLYKWFGHTWQVHSLSFHSDLFALGRHTCTRSHLVETYFILPFWPMLIGRHTCTSDLNKLGRNLMNHSLRQTYLYKWFDHTNRNLMYHSNLTNALRQTSDFVTLNLIFCHT